MSSLYVILGIQAQTVKLAWQPLYPLNNLLSVSHLFKQLFIHGYLFHTLDGISNIYFVALTEAI